MSSEERNARSSSSLIKTDVLRVPFYHPFNKPRLVEVALLPSSPSVRSSLSYIVSDRGEKINRL